MAEAAQKATETLEEHLERERDEARAVAEDRGRMNVGLARDFHKKSHPTRPPFWRCPLWPCRDVKPQEPWD